MSKVKPTKSKSKKPAKKAAKKKTGKFKSAMSGKFIKADAAKDNPYSTYRMKAKEKDNLREDIVEILESNYYTPQAQLLAIRKRVNKK